MENQVRELWKAGAPAHGGWLTVPHRLTAAAMGSAGYDYLVVDMQHGLIDIGQAVEMFGALAGSPSVAMARVTRNDPAEIGQVLDAGALGIIVPMVNSAVEAAAAVAACRYAPQGARSWGPTYAADIYDGYGTATANSNVLCIPMVETSQAVANLNEIVAVDGVDAIYVGPSDLAITYGLSPQGDRSDLLPEVLDSVVAACGNNVVPGIHTTAELAPMRREQGFRMITVATDLPALRNGAASMLARARGD